MGWDIFWATFSQAHLVTLMPAAAALVMPLLESYSAHFST
jgi:hypothetical protein